MLPGPKSWCPSHVSDSLFRGGGGGSVPATRDELTTEAWQGLLNYFSLLFAHLCLPRNLLTTYNYDMLAHHVANRTCIVTPTAIPWYVGVNPTSKGGWGWGSFIKLAGAAAGGGPGLGPSSL